MHDMQQCHRVLLIHTKGNRTKQFAKREVCTKFIITIMENNQLHKSGANRMLYNVSMKGLPLSPRMFI